MNAQRASLAVLILFALTLAACREEPPVHGPLRQEAYVWQRAWSPAVRDSLGQAKELAGVVVLAAEVDLRSRAPEVVRVPLDAEALKGLGRPVGVAVRVHAFPGRFVDDPKMIRNLQDLVRGVAGEAKAKGIALSEIQMDYDCPQSKLADYQGFLSALRTVTAPVPLTLTALPAWLHQRRAFRNLIETVDGYVLQLHSLEPPDNPNRDILLTDPRSARAWVAEAARFGRPFRVALSTYGYQVVFDAQGKLIGLLAEGPLVSYSAGTIVRQARSDPQAIAGLVRDWTAARPRELTGILWYRLPVTGERNNWTWPTLRAVMAGRAPEAGLRAETRKPQPGLVEIDLVNGGEAEAPWPPAVQVRWQHDTFLAADGLAGYALRREGSRAARLERPGEAPKGTLRPGERRVVAWLRFSAPTEEVQVELSRPAG
ncbi:MAG TPA: DUF3142 domain-containing protein [Thermoanaerobaculia bacterium]|nr:DUF3142 domain-containing protein [Thermoanaerobaculia bacterium]